MDKIQLINMIIQSLDQLTVQGTKNMALVLECIKALDALKGEITKEAQHEQHDQAE